MKIGFDSALGVHADALRLRAGRTQVLAQNIANADTPGYQARDIDFQSELNKALLGDTPTGRPDTSGLTRTSATHLPGQSSWTTLALKYRNPLMPSFDGNTVDAQTEQAEFAENNLQFVASLRFLDGKFKSLMGAIKGE